MSVQDCFDIAKAQRRCDKEYRALRNAEIREKKSSNSALSLVADEHFRVADIRRRLCCPECDSDDIECDRIGGYWVCTECGAVADELCAGDYRAETTQRPRESSPYNFVYHFNEIWAAYKGRGPLVHEDDLANIVDYIEHTFVLVFTASTFVPYDPATYTGVQPATVMLMDPYVMQRPHYVKVCKLVGLTSLGERWVQIKKRICGERWQVNYPSVAEENAVRAAFARFCNGFNRLLYTTGKKRTVKDNLFCNKSSALSRHNLPHYSWIVQNICHMLDPSLRERCQLDLFFPLPKTQPVRKKLGFTWALLCHHLGWEMALLQ